MKDFSHIEAGTGFMPSSDYELAGVIDHLKKMGLPTSPGVANYTPGVYLADGVGLIWNGDWVYFDRPRPLVSSTDFVALFEAPALPKIGDWQPTIIVDRNTLKVGCTEIPFSTVEAIYKAMKP